MTELYHFIRLLFVKLGVQHCPDCDIPIAAQSVESIKAQISKQYKGKKLELLAPLIVSRKGYYTDLAKWADNRGFDYLRVDDEYLATGEWPRLDRFKEHNIDLPVGEIEISTRNEDKLHELIQRALDYGKGVLKIGTPQHSKKKVAENLYSIKRACTNCGTSFPELDPRLFSYNSKHGWCESCFGTGVLSQEFDEEQTGEEEYWLQDDGETIDCTDCQGQRLNSIALAVQYDNHNIASLNQLSIKAARAVSYTHLTLPTILLV